MKIGKFAYLPKRTIQLVHMYSIFQIGIGITGLILLWQLKQVLPPGKLGVMVIVLLFSLMFLLFFPGKKSWIYYLAEWLRLRFLLILAMVFFGSVKLGLVLFPFKTLSTVFLILAGKQKCFPKKPKKRFISKDLRGKVAIITGSSRGLGKTIAIELGKVGVKIVLNGRNKETLANTLQQLQEQNITVTAFPGDVSNLTVCQQMIDHVIQEYGQLDLLINNAGIGVKGDFGDCVPEIFGKTIKVNILGSIHPTYAALPSLIENQGSILFVSSLAGLRGMPNKSIYGITKMAQTALAESLRTELNHQNVHVGIIYVGITENDPGKQALFSDGSWRILDEKKQFFTDSQQKVARTIKRSLKKRRFKTTVGWSGSLFFFLHRFTPGLMDFVFRHIRDFIQRVDK